MASQCLITLDFDQINCVSCIVYELLHIGRNWNKFVIIMKICKVNHISLIDRNMLCRVTIHLNSNAK